MFGWGSYEPKKFRFAESDSAVPERTKDLFRRACIGNKDAYMELGNEEHWDAMSGPMMDIYLRMPHCHQHYCYTSRALMPPAIPSEGVPKSTTNLDGVSPVTVKIKPGFPARVSATDAYQPIPVIDLADIPDVANSQTDTVISAEHVRSGFHQDQLTQATIAALPIVPKAEPHASSSEDVPKSLIIRIPKPRTCTLPRHPVADISAARVMSETFDELEDSISTAPNVISSYFPATAAKKPGRKSVFGPVPPVSTFVQHMGQHIQVDGMTVDIVELQVTVSRSEDWRAGFKTALKTLFSDKELYYSGVTTVDRQRLGLVASLVRLYCTECGIEQPSNRAMLEAFHGYLPLPPSKLPSRKKRQKIEMSQPAETESVTLA